jgi:hypothetical protein
VRYTCVQSINNNKLLFFYSFYANQRGFALLYKNSCEQVTEIMHNEKKLILYSVDYLRDEIPDTFSAS